MAPEFIFTMQDLRKVVPPRTEILKGIWLSFFWGAKIGVIGPNGAGKSTLLRIMAGVDTDFLGEAFPAKSAGVGYLPQEPQLDASKTVLGNIEEGVAATRARRSRADSAIAIATRSLPVGISSLMRSALAGMAIPKARMAVVIRVPTRLAMVIAVPSKRTERPDGALRHCCERQVACIAARTLAGV